jgi:hypothetical protein
VMVIVAVVLAPSATVAAVGATVMVKSATPAAVMVTVRPEEVEEEKVAAPP